MVIIPSLDGMTAAPIIDALNQENWLHARTGNLEKHVRACTWCECRRSLIERLIENAQAIAHTKEHVLMSDTPTITDAERVKQSQAYDMACNAMRNSLTALYAVLSIHRDAAQREGWARRNTSDMEDARRIVDDATLTLVQFINKETSHESHH